MPYEVRINRIPTYHARWLLTLYAKSDKADIPIYELKRMRVAIYD